ncbi:meiotic recombination protein REC8 homolog [Poeciliopsis prolifica]|uniref:meiotic recombination protein REC8 homolog n=1 Tax=Poeciliopsis prolifica TaxID=188132 RepID=UPI002412F7B4|nr:meiotic recombination protein REC8 homolog [Poeciliopsis prolifica]
MFYYPAVLNRRSGCFSTIWLVATKGIKVPRRDFLKVNVKRTCDDIMNYVLEKVAPPQPGLPPPRFSLYLSSQLQYGVVLVYHRQCTIFLEELRSILGQLLKQRSSGKTDLSVKSKSAAVLPDALVLMEDTEGAPDPLFGQMLLQDTLPSPTQLMQMNWETLQESFPEHQERSSSATSASPHLENGISASPESITLSEPVPTAAPAPEFDEEDFNDYLPETLDLLLDQPDHFQEGGLEQTRGEMRREEREKTKKMTPSISDLQPPTVSGSPELLPVEEPGPSEKRDQVTPVSAPGVPSPPSAAQRQRRCPESEVQKEVKKRRRRQLVFFDPETQLSETEQQEQIEDPLTETRAMAMAPPPSHRVIPAAELLSNPCSFLPEEILSLWRRAAVITALSGPDLQVGDRGPESTDSERGREGEGMQEAAAEDQRDGEISIEVQKGMEESELMRISAPSLEGLDQRETSRDISPLYTSEREGSTISMVLQDIPEAVDERTEELAVESPRLLPELADFENEPVLFQSVLPSGASRRTVSCMFQRLLENLSSQRISAEQEEPYRDIVILPGPRYEELDLPS